MFVDDWKGMRIPLNARKVTLAFFGHGNLALVRDKWGFETKIDSTSNADLLVNIARTWRSRDLAPVFVSEGTATEKQNAIGQSPYLRTVLNEVLPSLGKAIVIYGLGFNENDDHIVRALLKGSVETLAISVYCGTGSTSEDRQLYCAHAKSKFPGKQVYFFDAQSSGAWIYLSAADRARSGNKLAG